MSAHGYANTYSRSRPPPLLGKSLSTGHISQEIKPDIPFMQGVGGGTGTYEMDIITSPGEMYRNEAKYKQLV